MKVPGKLEAALVKGWETIKSDNETYAYLYPASIIIGAELQAVIFELRAAFAKYGQSDQILVGPPINLPKVPKMGVQLTVTILGEAYTWTFTISRNGDNAELNVLTGLKEQPIRTKWFPITETHNQEAEIRAFVRAEAESLLAGIAKDL